MTRKRAWTLTVVIGAWAALSIWFYLRQNQPGAMGGSISLAKQAWLSFTLIAWFALPVFIATDSRLDRTTRRLALVFAIAMYARVPFQLVIMYVTRSWHVAYGLSHDAIAILSLVIPALVWRRQLIEPVGPAAASLVRATRWYLAVIAGSLVLEMYYAASFFALVQGQTGGDQAVWFANASDPKFVQINTITAVFDVLLYAGLVAYLALLALGRGEASQRQQPAPT